MERKTSVHKSAAVLFMSMSRLDFVVQSGEVVQTVLERGITCQLTCGTFCARRPPWGGEFGPNRGLNSRIEQPGASSCARLKWGYDADAGWTTIAGA
jgi:hypothetical protein